MDTVSRAEIIFTEMFSKESTDSRRRAATVSAEHESQERRMYRLKKKNTVPTVFIRTMQVTD